MPSNNIAFARNYTAVIDEVYQRASVSGVLNSGRHSLWVLATIPACGKMIEAATDSRLVCQGWSKNRIPDQMWGLGGGSLSRR